MWRKCRRKLSTAFAWSLLCSIFPTCRRGSSKETETSLLSLPATEGVRWLSSSTLSIIFSMLRILRGLASTSNFFSRCIAWVLKITPQYGNDLGPGACDLSGSSSNPKVLNPSLRQKDATSECSACLSTKKKSSKKWSSAREKNSPQTSTQPFAYPTEVWDSVARSKWLSIHFM